MTCVPIFIHCGESYELQLVTESHVSHSTGATLKRDMLRDPISKRLDGAVLLHLFLFQVTLLHCFFAPPTPVHTHNVFFYSSSLHSVLHPFLLHSSLFLVLLYSSKTMHFLQFPTCSLTTCCFDVFFFSYITWSMLVLLLCTLQFIIRFGSHTTTKNQALSH